MVKVVIDLKNQDTVLNVDFLESYLKVKGLTPTEFANLIGVSNSMLNRAMNGKRGVGGKFIAGVMTNCKDITFSQMFSCVSQLPKGNKKTKTA